MAAAKAEGATILGMDDIATGNYNGVHGAWSSESGDGGGFVSSTPSNPNTVIANGASTAPALPGGPAVGVGATQQVGGGSPHKPDVVVLIVSTVGESLDAAVMIVMGAGLIEVGYYVVGIGAAASPLGVGIVIAAAGAGLMVAGGTLTLVGAMVAYKEWGQELGPSWVSVFRGGRN